MTRAGLVLLSIFVIPSGRTRAQDATQTPPAPVSMVWVSSTVGGTTYVSPVFEWPRSTDPRGEVSGPFAEFLTSKYSYPANTRVYCYVFFNSTGEATAYRTRRISQLVYGDAAKREFLDVAFRVCLRQYLRNTWLRRSGGDLHDRRVGVRLRRGEPVGSQALEVEFDRLAHAVLHLGPRLPGCNAARQVRRMG